VPPAACAPPGPTLTLRVVPAARKWTNTSSERLVSPGTRFVAREVKATTRPSAERLGQTLYPLACRPRGPRLTRRLVPARTSRTKMSNSPLVSPATRLVEVEQKATTRPSAESEGRMLNPSLCAPPRPTLTRRVVPAPTSRTNTSGWPLVSPGTRLVASDEKATKRPSAETAGSPPDPLACTPPGPTFTRSVLPARAGAAARVRPARARSAPARAAERALLLLVTGRVAMAFSPDRKAARSRAA
jgi:hypothetical protein